MVGILDAAREDSRFLSVPQSRSGEIKRSRGFLVATSFQLEDPRLEIPVEGFGKISVAPTIYMGTTGQPRDGGGKMSATKTRADVPLSPH